MNKILFVEDDAEYRALLSGLLENEGYSVDAVENALLGIHKNALVQYDLAISDLMMDTVDGIEFLAHIKRDNTQIKTIILTAEPSEDTELGSLNIHVDKYLSKDLRIDVILKHIENLLLSSEVKDTSIIIASEDNIILDTKAYTVSKQGEQLNFTPKEFGILRLLLENQGHAITRDEIIDVVWKDEGVNAVETRVVDVHMKSIRRKLGVQKIVAIRGIGYKWDM